MILTAKHDIIAEMTWRYDMFKLNEKNKIKYYTIQAFEDSGLVRHAFSTRIGGVSTGEAATMNFGFNRKDTVENIYKNFELLCNAVGIDNRSLVMTKQVHGNDVYAAKKVDIGKRIEAVDALVTNEAGVAICTFHADCTPLFFLDTKKKAIGLAHSGWRSTLLNIAAKTIEKMQSEYGCDPSNIIAAIGPSIGPCHFEVDSDVAEAFDEKYITRKDKPYIDLWRMCADQIIAAGVKEESLTSADICTFCSRDILYSYRGDKGKTGSMAAILELI